MQLISEFFSLKYLIYGWMHQLSDFSFRFSLLVFYDLSIQILKVNATHFRILFPEVEEFVGEIIVN